MSANNTKPPPTLARTEIKEVAPPGMVNLHQRTSVLGTDQQLLCKLRYQLDERKWTSTAVHAGGASVLVVVAKFGSLGGPSPPSRSRCGPNRDKTDHNGRRAHCPSATLKSQTFNGGRAHCTSATITSQTICLLGRASQGLELRQFPECLELLQNILRTPNWISAHEQNSQKDLI